FLPWYFPFWPGKAPLRHQESFPIPVEWIHLGSTAPCLAAEPCEVLAPKHSAATSHGRCQGDRAKSPSTATARCGDHLGRLHSRWIDVICRVRRNPIGVRGHPFEFDHDLGYLVLHTWMVSHRSRHIGDRRLLLDPLERQIEAIREPDNPVHQTQTLGAWCRGA